VSQASETLSWRNEIGRLFKLAGPLIVNNLSIALMQMADTVMAGKLGAASLAAVAVGGSLWFFAFTIGMGVLMAISPIAARHFGAGNPELIGRYTRQGIYLGIAFSIPVMLASHTLLQPLLTFIPIDVAFRDMTIGYTKAISLGAPGIFVFLALRYTTEGMGHTKPIMFFSIVALFVNVFLNWVLIFGHLGAPAMGPVGCGLASAITMWLLAFVLLIYMIFDKRYKALGIFSRLAPPRLKVLRELLVLGTPIAITITAEAGLFNAISILMGTLGAVISAGHQIAINFAMTFFMIPLALSSAITIRIGHELGAGQPHRARYAGGFGILICGGFMVCSAIILLVFRDVLVDFYTNDVEVQNVAISLLLMAAIFQVSDGIQVGAAGALRGYKDTRMPMLINTFAYWMVAFPLAYFAAVTYKMSPNYIWGGFVIGLGLAAILLSWRYIEVSRVPLEA
jgi:MATE family multidrug resistance protein